MLWISGVNPIQTINFISKCPKIGLKMRALDKKILQTFKGSQRYRYVIFFDANILSVSNSNYILNLFTKLFCCITPYKGAHGSIVVKALCYKPEGHGFETR
jgi:hypothetical protein